MHYGEHFMEGVLKFYEKGLEIKQFQIINYEAQHLLYLS